MKKIIIVNNNMRVGGVQKSLYNLLWTIAEDYDITLCLFCKSGAYADKIPPSVKVVEASGAYRYLGIGQRECKGMDFVKRGVLASLSRVLGRRRVLSGIKCRLAELEETYDCAISYLHNGRARSFYGGTQDFVLNCIKSRKKIAFLHGDYRNCGSNHASNNRQLAQFDVIAACSDGCRHSLVGVLPHLESKCVTVRNCHLFHEIEQWAEQSPVLYNEEVFNVLAVARLSREKGIDRVVRAISHAKNQGVNICLHVVGDGLERERLQILAEELSVTSFVTFYGEQKNPYRFMKQADLLIISSYHEAAPMVIDEARSLGLPVLTTETTSSRDMVAEVPCGWVCENSQEALNETLCRIASDKNAVVAMREVMSKSRIDNADAISEWQKVIEF